MRTEQKSVYYCDFCRRHRLSRTSMERHETTCTLNPSRVCRWRIDGHSNGSAVIEIEPLAAALLSRATAWPTYADPLDTATGERTYLTVEDVDWLRGEVEGCPACMLAALRQSGVDEFHLAHGGGTIFDYDAEVARLRSEELEAAEPW